MLFSLISDLVSLKNQRFAYLADGSQFFGVNMNIDQVALNETSALYFSIYV